MPNRWIVAMGAGVIAGAVTWFHLYLLQTSGNFHAIVPGEAYRSAQPSPDQLQRYVSEYGIKSVINLRSGDMSDSDRTIERDAAAKLGLVEIEYPMNAKRELSSRQIATLERLLRDAPKPVLIHCKRGADRTGLVSALYYQNIAGRSSIAAGEQLSIRYGHFSFPLITDAYGVDATWATIDRE